MKIKKTSNKSLYFGKYSMCYRATVPLMYYAKMATRKTYEVARLDLHAMCHIQKQAALRAISAKSTASNVRQTLHQPSNKSIFAKIYRTGQLPDSNSIEECFKDVYNELLWLVRFFNEAGDYRISTSVDTLYVYTSNHDIVDTLKMRGHDRASLTIITNPVPPGEVRLIESPYSFRSKLNARTFTQMEKEALERYIENSDAKPSLALKYWLGYSRSLNSKRYYHIDHNSTDILTLISLIKPGLVSHTSKITKPAK